MESDKTLNVRIISPKETLFTGQAVAVSSKNTFGKFDILPQHANFITIIENNPIEIHQSQNNVRTFNFPLAIIHTVNNHVNIYTQIELPHLSQMLN